MVLPYGKTARSSAGLAITREKACICTRSSLRKDLPELAGKSARLDHLAPALVGTPDSCLVHRRRRTGGGAQFRRGGRQGRYGQVDAGSGRFGHMVLFGALAVLDVRLARKH